MPHPSLGYVVIAFVCGGLSTGVYFTLLSVHSVRRDRRGVRPTGYPRSSEEMALAIAFEDMYREYRHDGQVHYLTPEDKEDVQAVVVRKLVGGLGDQRLLYQQVGYNYDDYLHQIAYTLSSELQSYFSSCE